MLERQPLGPELELELPPEFVTVILDGNGTIHQVQAYVGNEDRIVHDWSTGETTVEGNVELLAEADELAGPGRGL